MIFFESLSSHFDRAGSGFGNAFIPLQKCKFEFAQANMLRRDIACDLAYAYQNDIAEATLTLKNNDGAPVAAIKFVERWDNFGDAKKPLIHVVYNYDLYTGTPTDGWSRVAFAQNQESRGVPNKISAAILENLNILARAHALFPKVRSIAFGTRSPL